MPADLKLEIEQIATETRRTLSSAIELLLRRGVEEFRKDGVLIDTRTAAGSSRAPIPSDRNFETELAQELAKEISRFLTRRSSRSGEGVPPPKSRDGPKKSGRGSR
jgi:hypothetical protein